MNRNITTCCLSLLTGLLLLGCGSESRTAKGFRLPQGDVEKGKSAFLELQCNQCHKVAGADIALLEGGAEKPIILGGEVMRVRTYGQLVTAIIHPDYSLLKGYPKDMVEKEGHSLMSNFNDEMTAAQLIDIVAFLHSKYERMAPDYDNYVVY